jgi:hypothetical protein
MCTDLYSGGTDREKATQMADLFGPNLVRKEPQRVQDKPGINCAINCGILLWQ